MITDVNKKQKLKQVITRKNIIKILKFYHKNLKLEF